MCGIAGIISNNKIEDIESKKIFFLKKILFHRGPNHSDYFKNENIFLLHNRLSIIDIDKRSNQPMFSNCGNLILIFNGEIYNYLELKKLLVKSYNFKTNSDSEVLLAAYTKWGKNMLNYLCGAFTFCIYDKKNKKAFFARDRFGQKPIFFWKKNNSIIFASEIKFFKHLGYIPEMNKDLWGNYLSNSNTDNSRETFFKGIFQILPGEMLEFSKTKFKITRWYQLKDNIRPLKKNTKLEHIKEQFLDLISNSIKLNSRSDAKISISLSGGLDSNTLLAIYNSKKFFNKIPKCFSVDFEGFRIEKKLISESENLYNFKSDFTNFKKSKMISSMTNLLEITESPTGGLMNCALYEMYKNVSKKGYKVILDGTGLDEILGGYELTHLIYLKEMKKKNKTQFKLNLKNFSEFYNISITDVEKKINSLNQPISKTIDGFNMSKNIINPDFAKEKNQNQNQNNLFKHLIDYVQFSKIPRNNRLKDRASMFNSLELRLPFLEHELVEFCLGLPKELYFLKGRSKSILRESLKGMIPDKIRYKSKISQQSPQNEWLKEEPFKTYFSDLIHSKKFKERNIFNLKTLNKEWKNFLLGKADTSFFVWQVFCTENWFQKFID